MELCGTAHLHHTTHQPVYERFHHYSSSTEYVNRHHSDFIRIVLSITRAIQNPRSVTSCNHMFEENEKEEVQVLPSKYVAARSGPAPSSPPSPRLSSLTAHPPSHEIPTSRRCCSVNRERKDYTSTHTRCSLS